jgi:hypothetical protein
VGCGGMDWIELAQDTGGGWLHYRGDMTNPPIMGILKRILRHSTRPNGTYVKPVAVNRSYSTPDDGYGKYPKHVE